MEKLVRCVCGAKLKVPDTNGKFKCPICKRTHEWTDDYEFVDTVIKKNNNKSIVGFLGRGYRQLKLKRERVLLK